MFKESNGQILVDTYAMELYLPIEYVTSAYRGEPYYSVLSTKVRFLCVGNMRFFKSQKDVDNRDNIKVHPIGIPMLVTTEPSEIDTEEIKFSKNAPPRKCVVLSYNKGDAFLVNKEIIKNVDVMMMVLSRLEQGKLDIVPPEVAVSIVRDCERMNGVNLRIPSEEMEIFVAERYRDPDYPQRKYRYHTGKIDPTTMVSYNMRTDAMKSTTYQAITHEDVSNALVASVNRKDDGVVDEPTPMEAVVRGLNMDDLKKADIPPDEM